MVVQMGADGTEDNVSVKICSDTNDLCCENVMKKVPNEDWRQGKKQEWVAADFGDCKNLKFKVISRKLYFEQEQHKHLTIHEHTQSYTNSYMR